MEEVKTIEYKLNVPKETKEVIDLLDQVYEKVKAKADLNDYISLLDELHLAIDGIDKLDDEMKSKYRDDAMAYLTLKIGGKF